MTLTQGPLPDGACVLHRCDNPPCVRPDHLFLGTRADNNRDMVTKGRARVGVNPPVGERSGSVRLTSEQVRAIRDEHPRGGCTTRSLAAKYTVSQATINDILCGKTWKHLL
jgi:hypothetical protein